MQYPTRLCRGTHTPPRVHDCRCFGAVPLQEAPTTLTCNGAPVLTEWVERWPVRVDTKQITDQIAWFIPGQCGPRVVSYLVFTGHRPLRAHVVFTVYDHQTACASCTGPPAWAFRSGRRTWGHTGTCCVGIVDVVLVGGGPVGPPSWAQRSDAGSPPTPRRAPSVRRSTGCLTPPPSPLPSPAPGLPSHAADTVALLGFLVQCGVRACLF